MKGKEEKGGGKTWRSRGDRKINKEGKRQEEGGIEKNERGRKARKEIRKVKK